MLAVKVQPAQGLQINHIRRVVDTGLYAGLHPQDKGPCQACHRKLKKGFYRKDPLTEALSPEAEFFTDLSLDSPIPRFKHAGAGADAQTTHLDMLCSTEPEPMDALSTIEEKAIVQSDVHGALAVLNDRERLVVEKRFMAEEPLSLQAVGDMLGITRERVRQIESSAVKKLKNALAGKKALLALTLTPLLENSNLCPNLPSRNKFFLYL